MPGFSTESFSHGQMRFINGKPFGLFQVVREISGTDLQLRRNAAVEIPRRFDVGLSGLRSTHIPLDSGVLGCASGGKVLSPQPSYHRFCIACFQ